MHLNNYLKNLDPHIKLFGFGTLLRKVHNTKLALEFLKRNKLHPSTYYKWLNNEAPVRLDFLIFLANKQSNILDEAYLEMKWVSVGEKKCILPKVINEDLAYLLGALHGDGSLNKNKKYIHLTCDSYEYIKTTIAPLFKRLFNVSSTIRTIKSKNDYYRIEIGSKVVHSFISMFAPIGKKKGKLEIPTEIIRDKCLLRAYLTGLFDTDGCISHTTNKKQCYFLFTQADNKFVCSVRSALAKLHIDMNSPKKFICKHPHNDKLLEGYRIYTGKHSTLLKILETFDFQYPDKRLKSREILKILNGPGRIRTCDLPYLESGSQSSETAFVKRTS